MAIRILRNIFFPTPKHKILSLSSFSTSPPSDNAQTTISTVVSVLTHQRSKSRWSYLCSLCPNGFNPDQFSQIALHIKNNPHLVLRFFLWTQRKSLCDHNLLSYSTTIHILARGRLKSQARTLIREAIRVSRSEGIESKPLKLFETLVKTYRQCGSAPFVFDLLIKACLESKKIEPSIEIVRMLLSRGISPNLSTCSSLIRQVSQCCGAQVGYEMYREIFGLDCENGEENRRMVARISPNVEIFNTLMVAFYQDRLVDKVKEIWDQIGDWNCNPNGYSYSILIAAYCDEGKMDEAEILWEEMKAKNVEADVVAFNTIIGGFCQIGEIEKAEAFFRDMTFSGIESSCITYEHLISGYCKMGNVDSALMVYKDMLRKDFRPEASTMEAMIRGLCEVSRVVEGLEIFGRAKGHFDFHPTRKSYEFLIEGLCQEGKMEEALKLQAEMVAKGFTPSCEIYSVFISGYMKGGNMEVADKLRIEMLETQICREKGLELSLES